MKRVEPAKVGRSNWMNQAGEAKKIRLVAKKSGQ